MSGPRVAIIGAGIGGLTAAHKLSRRGITCDVFEASSHIGGAIRTIREDGWVMELGPNTLLDRGGVISSLTHELGIQSERLYPSTRANNRFIVRDRTLHALPTSPTKLIKSALFSRQAKLRLLAEPLIPALDEGDPIDESLYNFASRRLGEEFVDYALDPFLAGTYASCPQRLSSTYALGRLKEFEESAGSIFRGAFTSVRRAKRARKKSKGSAPPRATLISFERGVETITDALAASISGDLHLNARVTSLKQDATTHRWTLTVASSGKIKKKKSKKRAAKSVTYSDVFVALPAYAISALSITPAWSDEPLDLSSFDAIEHPPITMLALGFARAQFRHDLDGFGMLIPSKEPYTHLGSVFASSIFRDRAPRGHVQLVAFLGGARRPESALLKEDEQLDIVHRELHDLLGLRGEALKVERRFWAHSIPQYDVGYGKVLAPIEALEHRLDGVLFGGNWRDGIAVPDVITAASTHAERIAHT